MKIAIITVCVIAGILAYAMMGVATVYIMAAVDDADLDHNLDDYFGFGIFWPAVWVILVGKLACFIVTPIAKAIVRVPIAIITVIRGERD